MFVILSCPLQLNADAKTFSAVSLLPSSPLELIFSRLTTINPWL